MKAIIRGRDFAIGLLVPDPWQLLPRPEKGYSVAVKECREAL